MKPDTEQIIEALKADGEPKLLLLAADRLEELQRLNDSMQVDRDLWIKVGREKLDELQRANQNALADLALMIEQRDEASAEVERLQAEVKTWKSYCDLEKATVKESFTTRPEPSRLEIAAMMMAANLSRETEQWDTYVESTWAIEQADALIAAAGGGNDQRTNQRGDCGGLWVERCLETPRC